ncbi:hypothetical protein OH799_18380 [Nocardia sp. NBC_00881]|uniref:hypothetical protein n=1 Tax=Nocardia sp. NBC_00881 TaxID=2975995 RepID=UPI00386AE40F|nr:hypothetical protein OH799_18380 [Nocardia sp. NBC_00881]
MIKVFPDLARVLGVLMVIDSLLLMVLYTGGLWTDVAFLIVGLASWLSGHRMRAAGNGVWRSKIAMRAFRLPVLRMLAPVGVKCVGD